MTLAAATTDGRRSKRIVETYFWLEVAAITKNSTHDAKRIRGTWRRTGGGCCYFDNCLYSFSDPEIQPPFNWHVSLFQSGAIGSKAQAISGRVFTFTALSYIIGKYML